MRKEVLAGLGLAFIGLGVAAPAAAEDWRVCVVGMCFKDVCNPTEASVGVTMPVDVNDPAVYDVTRLKDTLVYTMLEKGTPTGERAENCVGPFATEAEAQQKTMAIYENMRNSFPDVTIYRAQELFPAYGQASSAASASASASSDASGDASDPDPDAASESASSDDGAAAARAESEAAAQAQREALAQRARDEAAAIEAEQRKRAEAVAATEAAAQRDREARQKAMAELEAKNSNDDANQCVSGATLRENDTFQGNTAAYVTNGCGRPVDVRICLMTEAKGWNCGMTYGLSPQSSWSWSSMHATGQVFQDARISGSQRTMQSP